MREHIIGRFPKSSLTAFIIAIVVVGRAAVGIVMPSAAAGPRQSFAPNFGESSGIVIVSPTRAPSAPSSVPARIDVPPAVGAMHPPADVRDATDAEPAPQHAL
ncbi:MAG TPA: hypothetical protein VG871_05970 [Vicinamibacterales bacterium]|nr:hypothetical protein [Vicinamibacterales bacterium]